MATPSSAAAGWERHVRDTLTRLSEQLDAGLLRLRTDGSRLVVDPPGEGGRGIVLPTGQTSLLAPVLPARSPRSLLSALYIASPQRQVNVPAHCIVRDHSRALIGHDNGLPPPEAIVVLSLRGEDGEPMYGWYVRYHSQLRRLVKLPPSDCRKLARAMAGDNNLGRSSLLQEHLDAWCTGLDESDVDFNSIAITRFMNYRQRVSRACKHPLAPTATVTNTASKRPRLEPHTPTTPPPCESHETCLICLEESESAARRCRHDSCGVHVCADCHASSRGLCPLCDRTAINADFPCSCCNKLSRLQQYGFPCTGCKANSLCKDCFMNFRECAACDLGSAPW